MMKGINPHDSWDGLVDYVLPKVMVTETKEEWERQKQHRQEQALQLAAAALRAAGEFTLADNLLN